MKKDVFISYKAEEFEAADWVRATLENNGISCWMAPESIPGGASYATEIPNAIKNCRVFVLILSEKSQCSIWVSKELDRALNEKKTIMPFMLENCILKNDFNFYLSNVQRYNAYENKAAAMEKMLREIRALTGRETARREVSQNRKPTELEWAVCYPNERSRDEECQIKGGSASWKAERGHQGEFQVIFYRADLMGYDRDEEGRMVGQEVGRLTSGFHTRTGFVHFSVNLFDLHISEKTFETGYYYFTVKAVGDKRGFEDSETARSGDWLYIRPQKQLPELKACWKWPDIQLEKPVDSPYLGGYAIKLYFKSPKDDRPKFLCGSPLEQLQENGTLKEKHVLGMARIKAPGKFYFKVSAISNDLTECRNGKWSELSEAHEVT